MSREIEDFLRRIAEQSAREAAAADEDDEIIDAEIVDDVVSADELRGETVAEHVATHMGTSVFDERAARLGDAIENADERMDQRLSEVFQHKLGQLGSSTDRPEASTLDERAAAAADKPEEATIKVAEMFRSPQSVRNAFILSEIIVRPEHRW